jgi:hypothetical protein
VAEAAVVVVLLLMLLVNQAAQVSSLFVMLAHKKVLAVQ